MLPSQQLDIDYRWVALDLDQSCKILGEKVESEFRKRLEEYSEAKNPKQHHSKGVSSHREYQPVEDWETNEVWGQAVGRVVEDTLVFFEDGKRSPDNPDQYEGLEYVKSKPIRWRTEKPITGVPKVDRSPGHGARTKFDELGRKRLEFDSEGKIVYRWSPPDGNPK